jgi:hypothetical protein
MKFTFTRVSADRKGSLDNFAELHAFSGKRGACNHPSAQENTRPTRTRLLKRRYLGNEKRNEKTNYIARDLKNVHRNFPNSG